MKLHTPALYPFLLFVFKEKKTKDLFLAGIKNAVYDINPSKIRKKDNKVSKKRQVKLDNKLTARHLLDFLRDLFNAKIIFSKEREKFLAGKLPNFAVINNLTENFCFPLKENSHYLFRKTESDSAISTASQILDFLISALFHEMLGLKEAVYILTYYKPVFKKMQKDNVQHHDPLIQVGARMIEDNEEIIPKQIEDVENFWQQIFKLLPEVLHQYSDNIILSRFLFKHRDKLEGVYGKGNWFSFIDSTFPRGFFDAILSTGINYARSSHFSLALEIFEDAVEYYNSKDLNLSRKTKNLPHLWAEVLKYLKTESEKKTPILKKLNN